MVHGRTQARGADPIDLGHDVFEAVSARSMEARLILAGAQGAGPRSSTGVQAGGPKALGEASSKLSPACSIGAVHESTVHGTKAA